MEYAAIALISSGFMVGLFLRLKTLFLSIGLLLIVCVALSVKQGSSFFEAFVILAIAQTILQVSYFLGAALRYFFLQGRMKTVV